MFSPWCKRFDPSGPTLREGGVAEEIDSGFRLFRWTNAGFLLDGI